MLHHAIMNEGGTYEAVDNEEECTPALVDQPEDFSIESSADIILEMNAIDSVKKGTFGKLVNVALHIVGESAITGVEAHEMLAVHLDLAEESAITQTNEAPERYAQGEKAGKIKTEKYLSKTYKHARSTLINFLKNGGSLTDNDGNVKGKTAIEKEKKEAKKKEKTPEEKLAFIALTVKALLSQCDDPTESWVDFKSLVVK